MYHDSKAQKLIVTNLPFFLLCLRLCISQEGWHDEPHEKLAKHSQKVEGSKDSFPHLDVEKFPHEQK